jgi:hypothetical protein
MAAKPAMFEDAASDRASNLRSAATSLHCHQVDGCALFGCATSADHFSPSPMVGSRGSAAPALIPTIRAGGLVHEFTWSDSHGAEPSSRIGRGGFDYHGRACLRPET